jgi:hypothetical protein
MCAPSQVRPGHNLSLLRRIISPLNFGVLITQDQKTFVTFGKTFKSVGSGQELLAAITSVSALSSPA